ncbi:hypothetical protein TWF506_009430 [Arthrobotrys conoides]|uniref:Ankyrin repeat protein n=1 Tax=Arthrobotrys conoides TaxID=74498 RepID=A0AAN8NIG7_9PEZI
MLLLFLTIIELKSQTPLSRAIEKGDDTIVEILLKNGAQPDLEDQNGWRFPSHDIWDKYSSYLPNSLEVITLLNSCDLHSVDTVCAMDKIGEYYFGTARFDEAMQWNEQTLVGKEKALGEDHPPEWSGLI